MFSPFFLLAFLIAVGLPAWWLGYLALLARPASAATPDQLEWYPAGRLVFWAALLGAVVVVAAIPHFGSDAESFRAELKNGFERLFRLQTGTPAGEPVKLPGIADANALFDLFVIAIPPIAAAFTTATLMFNLWLAARVVALSGRLRRPWPDLTAIALPALRIGPARGRLGGDSSCRDFVGLVAGFLVATLLVALCGARSCGAARHHARTCKARVVVLATVYATIAMFGWPLVGIILLGLVDAAVRSAPPRAGAARTAGAAELNVMNFPLNLIDGETIMEVILLERVAKLGQMGDVVRVKDGFARNFLLPKGKALRATKDNRTKFEGMKAQLETRNLELKGEADKVGEKLDGQTFVVHPAGVGYRAALRLGVGARPRHGHDRGRVQRQPQPDRAQRADQDHRAAQGAGRAASRGRGRRHGQRRPQRRRSRTDRPRRGRDRRGARRWRPRSPRPKPSSKIRKPRPQPARSPPRRSERR